MPFSLEPALKRTPLDALIRMDAPVAGLRPLRARRLTTSKLPKPTSWTFWFFFKDAEIVLRTAAKVSVAAMTMCARAARWRVRC